MNAPLYRWLLAPAAGLAAAALTVSCCPCQAGGPKPLSADDAADSGASAAGAEAYAYKSATILGGGFVTGVIFSPAEPGLAYARTDIGGAYRWQPDSGEWLPITDSLGRTQNNLMGVESLGVDPSDADRVYLAVGTYTQDWAGAGAMMRSRDRGDTWEIVDMPIKMGGNENGRGNGERLAVDPNDNEIVLFGSRKYGLWRSGDAGESWAEGSFPKKEEPLGVGITFVLFDAASGKKGQPTPVVYAGWGSSSEGSLFRSKDNGASWELVPGQPQGLMPSHGDLDGNGVLYLSYGDHPGPSEVRNGALWKLETKTGKWTEITPVKPNKVQRFGYGGVAVSHSKPGVVMAVTIDRWGPGDDIFRSADGGKSWQALHAKSERDMAGAKYLLWGRDEGEPKSISATGWMADIALDPFDDGHAMYVTGQGVWRSTNADAADAGEPTAWTFTNRGLEETAVTDLASPPVGPPLLSAMGDLGGFRHDDLNEPSPGGMFQNPIFGYGSSLDFAESKPEVFVRAGSPSGDDKGVFGALSKDSGATWTPFPSSPDGATGRGAIVIAADASAILWASKDAAVHVSTDEGATWKLSEGLPEAKNVPDWAPAQFRVAADRVNGKKFYVYDAMSGSVFFSEDAGQTFAESSSGLPSLADYQLNPADTHAVPGHEGHVWITTGQSLFRSTDSGATYTSVDGIEESYGIGFGKAKQGTDYPAIYLSARIDDTDGIYRSDDEGKSWVRINTDRQRFGGTDLVAGDPRVYGRVYIGTHGRGILYGEPK